MTSEEADAMEHQWSDFFRILWKQQRIEDQLHPKGCSMMHCLHPWDERVKTKSQEMWQWDDHVLKNYRYTLVPVASMGTWDA